MHGWVNRWFPPKYRWACFAVAAAVWIFLAWCARRDGYEIVATIDVICGLVSIVLAFSSVEHSGRA